MCKKREKRHTQFHIYIYTTREQNLWTHKYFTRYHWLSFGHPLKMQSYTHMFKNNWKTEGEEIHHFALALRINTTFSVKLLRTWTTGGASSLPLWRGSCTLVNLNKVWLAGWVIEYTLNWVEGLKQTKILDRLKYDHQTLLHSCTFKQSSRRKEKKSRKFANTQEGIQSWSYREIKKNNSKEKNSNTILKVPNVTCYI